MQSKVIILPIIRFSIVNTQSRDLDVQGSQNISFWDGMIDFLRSWHNLS